MRRLGGIHGGVTSPIPNHQRLAPTPEPDCPMQTLQASCALLLGALVSGCGGAANAPTTGTGPNPQLPAPEKALLPTVNIAPAVGWAEGQQPVAREGLTVTAFATGLDHPRWVHVLPNGDVLVAESNAPPKPAEKGLKVWVTKWVMKRAGAGVPSANRITLLRDANDDGIAETHEVFLTGLYSPFGMADIGPAIYIANADGVVKVPYTAGDSRASAPPVRVAPLPGGPRNHHWTKNLIASKDGSKLYAAVGSNSNVAENGMGEEEGRAAIWEIDVASGQSRIFASGLRNPVGMAFEPVTGALWTSVNERDELGDELVPDYMTSVKDGGFYGWPYSYFGQNVDVRVKPQDPAKVASAIVPDYALGSHTASLGLADAAQNTLGPGFAQGMFVGQHGSWNRSVHSGYKVIFVPFANGRPAGDPVDVLTGFLTDDGKALGRPAGVAIDKRGGLLVADDVGNVIWRVTGPGNAAPAAAAAPTAP